MLKEITNGKITYSINSDGKLPAGFKWRDKTAEVKVGKKPKKVEEVKTEETTEVKVETTETTEK